MMMPRSTARFSTFCLLGLGVLTIYTSLAIAAPPAGDPMHAGAVLMQMPENLGTNERPLVLFDHQVHAAALEDQGCSTCHDIQDGKLSPGLAATTGINDRDLLIDTVHNTCMSCHRERAAAALPSGPVGCGECHVRRGALVSERLAMHFDYSLHGRHSLAFEDKCETCHHVWDEAEQKLVHRKGEEDGCNACHGIKDEDKKPSLRNASHRACVSCHLQREEKAQDSGPTRCAGCHGAEQRKTIKQLEEIPRLQRNHPDTLWVSVSDGRSQVVPFNHLNHEQHSRACSDCHHQSLKKCSSCHTISGLEEGGNVLLERAFHMPDSKNSCVGCHRRYETEPGCVGCHSSSADQISESTCRVCHSGPAATVVSDELAPPSMAEAVLPPLPPTSDAFPEEVTIEVLVDAYEPSRLPHRKIVEKLDAAVRESRLAQGFHGSSETLCSGCHHHSPVGSRPPQCRACHGREAHATRDMPALKAAYHRQCIGCHQRMAINKQGCTDCHAQREVHS